MRQLPLLEKVQYQRLSGSMENPIHEIPHHFFHDFVLRARGPVNKSTIPLRRFEIPFLLESLQGCHYACVGNLAPLEEFFVNIPDCRFSSGPDNLHEFELVIGEQSFARSHY